MENKRKDTHPLDDIKPVSRPSNEEIDDDIADDVINSSTSPQHKFHKTQESSEGMED